MTEQQAHVKKHKQMTIIEPGKNVTKESWLQRVETHQEIKVVSA